MRAPTAAELLDAWEIGAHRPVNERALVLLAAACPESSDEELWELPIGARDARLLELRLRLFGQELAIVTACPACGESLESTARVDDLRQAESECADPAPVQQRQIGDLRVTFRLPTSRDLASVAAERSPAAGRDALLERCIAEVRNAAGELLDATALSPRASELVVEQMALLDPQADTRLELTCALCAHRWTAAFDIAAFLWKEVQAWAQRTLRDVYRFARAFGWTERETLALSPMRRQIYMELCRQ